MPKSRKSSQMLGYVAISASICLMSGHNATATERPELPTVEKVQKAAAPNRPRGHYSISAKCLPTSLKSRLAEIERRWGPVRIVSTYRHGAVIAGSGSPSLHASCRAVDFHPPKGSYRAVARWLKARHPGGVGTYSCAMHHLHIDNGSRLRWHHCVDNRGMKK